MELNGKKIGFAMTGSFCTFRRVLDAAKKLRETDCDILPIMSETSYYTDTRFGSSDEFSGILSSVSGKDIIKSVKEAEPIGPKKLLDLIIVMPCTGNTLAKLANGITDTAVTMAVKAHLRNDRPVLIGVSTNDALGGSAKNIGYLMNTKNIYFIPLSQDDSENKPNSLVANFELVIDAAKAALDGKQLQPIIY